MSLILASGSAIRRDLLKNAGLDFTVHPAAIDERAVEQAYLAAHNSAVAGLPAHIATAKAQASAAATAKTHTSAFVIGADQILVFEGQALAKPASPQEAKSRLRAMRGKDHVLSCGVAIIQDGRVLWTYADTAHLTMRNFSDDFLDDYCERAGAALTASVGAYALEESGIQLFDAIQGDYFTILGLPMLPLLSALRDFDVLGA